MARVARRNTAQSDDAFAVALAGRRYSAPKTTSGQLGRGADVLSFAAPTGSVTIPLGCDEHERLIEIDLGELVAGRLIIQAVPDAGKSYTLRRILEQAAPYIQEIIIDPEGEFSNLGALFGHHVIEVHRLDAAAMALLGERVRASRISVVLDFSQLTRVEQLKRLPPFVKALVELPRESWTPALFALDEAQLFAPRPTDDGAPPAIRKASVAAVNDIMGRGRKRGLAGLLATQRFAQLATSSSSTAKNHLIGNNTLDIDIKRAAGAIGWAPRQAFDRLPELRSGEFVAVGRAFSFQPAIVTVGPTKSRHIGATPAIGPAPAIVDALTASRALQLDQLAAESDLQGDEEDAHMRTGWRAVRGFLRDGAFGHAAALYGALKPLAPKGATLANLCTHLSCSMDELGAAIALLASFGVVELSDGEAGRAVALARDYAKWRA